MENIARNHWDTFRDLVDRAVQMASTAPPAYEPRWLFWCKSGKHRSVAACEAVAYALRARGAQVVPPAVGEGNMESEREEGEQIRGNAGIVMGLAGGGGGGGGVACVAG